ncbi:polysaccharide deacetylase family protein [Thermococcus sp.]
MSTTEEWRKDFQRSLTCLRKKRLGTFLYLQHRWQRNAPHLVKRVIDEGHELGCHAYNHEHLDRLSKARLKWL